MPISIKIKPQYRLILTRFSGLVERQDYVKTYRSVLSCPPGKKVPHQGFNELCDLRPVEVLDLDMATFEIVANLSATFHAPTEVKTAVIYDKDINRRLAKLYQIIAAQEQIEDMQFFEDPADALAWLDLPATAYQGLDLAPRLERA